MDQPPAKWIAAFQPEQVRRSDTVRVYLTNRWSLGIVCKTCGRPVEWTPEELERRFRDKLDTPIRAIAERLVCSDPECGSKGVAVFPSPYQGPWRWSAD